MAARCPPATSCAARPTLALALALALALTLTLTLTLNLTLTLARYVSDMTRYAALNAAYSAAFAGVAPAARAAVELPLAAGRAFCLEAVRQ